MRCLIVEDERGVRESIAELVPWGRLGFEQPLTASNGLQALDLLRRDALDLVISDVRMPRMNGVELLKAMRDEGMEQPFLFISGYSDKEYLMAAIRYRAVDYLEKPVMIPELIERIHSISERMNTPKGWVAAHELFEPGARRPPLFAEVRRFYVGVLLVSADGLRLTSQQLDRIVRSFHREALFEMETPERSTLVVGEVDREVNFLALVEALNHAGGGYALCLSDPVSELSQLTQAYQQADECATMSWMRPLRGLHRFSSLIQADDERCAAVSRNFAALREKKLWTLMRDEADAVLRSLREQDEMGRSAALEIMGAMASAIGPIDVKELEECASFEEAASRLLERIDAGVEEQMEQQLSPNVVRAIRYITDNLSGTLSVSEIAQAAYVSSSHLSYLFRQDMGGSIKQYIISMRIERAKRLLLDGEQSVQEVARAVGIADEVYFSKLFKRMTGRTPSKFAREEEEADEKDAYEAPVD